MIRKLPQSVISRIASGQIAVSPSNVLKELVENSLDANSQNISVFISDQFNFRVVDDGKGIRFQEIPVAVERFTTEKIKDIKDFDHIRTYGFRGEALNAIASVSRMVLKSRHYSEDIGGKLIVEAGEVRDFKAVAIKPGTSVSVCDLFFNVPVRKRSFKKREITKMFSLVLDYAIVNPEVSFKIGDFRLPSSSVEERIGSVYGKEVLRRVETENALMFLSFKNERSPKKKIRKIFINRRPVINEKFEKLLLNLGVENFILFLELPPSKVDFNVTPLKDKVLLKDESNYINEIRSAVQRKTFYVFQPLSTLSVKEESPEKPLKVIGCNGTLIFAEDRDYFYFLDLHLVHERVNYEMLLDQLKSGKFRSLKLLDPIPFEGSEKVLSDFGIKWSKVGKKVFVVEMPELLKVSDLKMLSEGKVPETISQLACKKSVKSGDRLSDEDLEELLKLYARCKEKRLCPHGRPIYYRISKREVYRNLGRLL